MTAHSQPMRMALRRRLFFSLLLALTLPLVSCDSGGPNEPPEWVGTWKLSEASGWEPTSPRYYDFSEDALIYILYFDPENPGSCIRTTRDVVETDGNVVTTSISGGTQKAQYVVTDEVLTVTILETDADSYAAPSSGDEYVATAIDGDHRAVAGCEQ